MGEPGPRVLTFAPILDLEDIPLKQLIKHLLKLCEEVMGHQVEIEFAMTLNRRKGTAARFGFLQVRPMFVSKAMVNVQLEDLEKPNVLVASEDVLGNGSMNNISNVVYLRRRVSTKKKAGLIASELEVINHQLDRRWSSVPAHCLRPTGDNRSAVWHSCELVANIRSQSNCGSIAAGDEC